MKDPYEKAFEEIGKTFQTIYNMIVWIAKRTLTTHDFEMFAKEFDAKKGNGDPE